MSGGAPRASSRDVSSTIPAPYSMQKMAIIFSSASRWLAHQIRKSAPLRLPGYAVGFWYAAEISANAWIFITRMPGTANPRNVSSATMRSRSITGWAFAIMFPP